VSVPGVLRLTSLAIVLVLARSLLFLMALAVFVVVRIHRHPCLLPSVFVVCWFVALLLLLLLFVYRVVGFSITVNFGVSNRF
jgi:hypothetical protein